VFILGGSFNEKEKENTLHAALVLLPPVDASGYTQHRNALYADFVATAVLA
jgi:hypothetical protein